MSPASRRIDTQTLYAEINNRARTLYLDWYTYRITDDEYLDGVVRLVDQPLVAFIFNVLGVTNPEDRKDMYQEVMLRFLQSGPNLAEKPALFWLFKVATNVNTDHWRKASRERLVPNNEIPAFEPASEGPTAEDKRIAELTVADAFRELPKEWRPAAYLCLGPPRYTQSAAAEILKLPETTINYYVGMARKRLNANPKLQELLGIDQEVQG
jgi:DNA-directed RNA polymerase specialized sigma24 family protein